MISKGMKLIWLIFFFEIPRKFDCVRGCKFMSVVKHQPWGSRGCWWGWRKGAPSYNSTVHVQQHAQQGYLQVSYNTTQVVVVVVGFTIHTHISYSYQLLPYWPLVYQPCHRHISLILFTQVRACQSASTVVCVCVQGAVVCDIHVVMYASTFIQYMNVQYTLYQPYYFQNLS